MVISSEHCYSQFRTLGEPKNCSKEREFEKADSKWLKGNMIQGKEFEFEDLGKITEFELPGSNFYGNKS